jgi:hypothetical protein
MTDLQQTAEAQANQVNAEAILEFNSQVDNALNMFRAIANTAAQESGQQPIAIGLAASLVAAEIASVSGANTGRSEDEVMNLLTSLFSDMQAHAKRVFADQQAARATVPAVDPLAAEDIAFREVAANDA